MIEIREDDISKIKAIINETRSLRPQELEQEENITKSGCVFCHGNENKTPPEISRIGGDKWTIRVFPNKFPILIMQEYKPLNTGFNKSWKGHGNNEVIVLTPEENEKPFSFSVKKWTEVLECYCERIKDNYKIPGIKYVLVFHNQGKRAGASINHTHSQVVSLPFIPESIITEHKSCSNKICCKQIENELKKNRLVFKNKEFIIFTNFASRFAFEAHIYPRKHVSSLTLLNKDSIQLLAEALHSLMSAYKKVFKSVDYNFVLHDAPKGKDFHFHIEFYPRVNKFAGVENGAGVYVNNISPETAAKLLRDAL